jgi:lysophospholipase L1-like esterase
VIASQNVIKTIRVNLSDIIDEIKRINPSVKIYIVGYFNLLPQKINDDSEKFNHDYPEFNMNLEEIALKKEARFVGIEEVFKDNYRDFLPVIGDVHPNELGHEIISKRIIGTMNK